MYDLKEYEDNSITYKVTRINDERLYPEVLIMESPTGEVCTSCDCREIMKFLTGSDHCQDHQHRLKAKGEERAAKSDVTRPGVSIKPDDMVG